MEAIASAAVLVLWTLGLGFTIGGFWSIRDLRDPDVVDVSLSNGARFFVAAGIWALVLVVLKTGGQ